MYDGKELHKSCLNLSTDRLADVDKAMSQYIQQAGGIFDHKVEQEYHTFTRLINQLTTQEQNTSTDEVLIPCGVSQIPLQNYVQHQTLHTETAKKPTHKAMIDEKSAIIAAKATTSTSNTVSLKKRCEVCERMIFEDEFPSHQHAHVLADQQKQNLQILQDQKRMQTKDEKDDDWIVL